MEALGCSNKKAITIMKELDSNAGIGLIEKKRQCQGKATMIYIKQFMLSEAQNVQKCKKYTSKSIVEEAKEKGRDTLYRVSEFLGIKKRLLDIRENVRGAIKTSDKDIAKTALLAKGFREAGQTAANAFRTFADKPEVDYSQKEQKQTEPERSFMIPDFRS